ncbi:MAG: hypothetical protein AAF657_24640 [Acidobacteriota bacterium]
MRSPSAAIAWEFRSQHRWGLGALALYFGALVAIRVVALEPGQRNALTENRHLGLVVVVPLAATFTYFLAVFSFGLAGDLAGRRSIHPAQLFILPVTNAALVSWPMLYGSFGLTSRSIDATDQMWSFFERHHLDVRSRPNPPV